jgi:uncharacterized protein (DUF2062 family)
MTGYETGALLAALALLVAVVPLTARTVDALLARRRRRSHERAAAAFLRGAWRDALLPDDRNGR